MTLYSKFYFVGLITVLIQGVLPVGSSNFLVVVYAISNSGSMALLFICSVLCLEVIWRASQFMYKRSKVHTYDLRNAIKKTKQMMIKVRGIKEYELASLDRPKSRRHISGMSDEEIIREFSQHENEVQNYLRERQKIIDKAAYMVFSEDGTSIDRESFSHFWRDSCGYYSNAAILFFYGGSALLFIATMTYMWARNDYVLQSPVAAEVSVYLISFALLTSMALVVYLRYYDKQYLEGKDKFERDNRKAEIRLNKADEALLRRSEPLEIPLPFGASTPRRSYFNHRDTGEVRRTSVTGLNGGMGGVGGVGAVEVNREGEVKEEQGGVSNVRTFNNSSQTSNNNNNLNNEYNSEGTNIQNNVPNRDVLNTSTKDMLRNNSGLGPSSSTFHSFNLSTIPEDDNE